MGTSNGMHVMKFTQDGKHVLTIGEPGVNKGSNDPDHLGGPANFYVEPKTNELFIADGYINKRVVVYDAATGKYKRHWGAYGKPPIDTEKYEYPVKPASPPQQYSTLHGLVGTKDGLIYVSDRRGNRIQVFRQNGEYLMERFVRPGDRRVGQRLQPAGLARRRSRACSISSTAPTSACGSCAARTWRFSIASAARAASPASSSAPT